MWAESWWQKEFAPVWRGLEPVLGDRFFVWGVSVLNDFALEHS